MERLTLSQLSNYTGPLITFVWPPANIRLYTKYRNVQRDSSLLCFCSSKSFQLIDSKYLLPLSALLYRKQLDWVMHHLKSAFWACKIDVKMEVVVSFNAVTIDPQSAEFTEGIKRYQNVQQNPFFSVKNTVGSNCWRDVSRSQSVSCSRISDYKEQAGYKIRWAEDVCCIVCKLTHAPAHALAALVLPNMVVMINIITAYIMFTGYSATFWYRTEAQ